MSAYFPLPLEGEVDPRSGSGGGFFFFYLDRLTYSFRTLPLKGEGKASSCAAPATRASHLMNFPTRDPA